MVLEEFGVKIALFWQLPRIVGLAFGFGGQYSSEMCSGLFIIFK
jgi:hypothetical protein